MCAVIRHLNGTHHNMRHDSQWFRAVTFVIKLWEEICYFSSFLFCLQTLKHIQTQRQFKTHTHTLTVSKHSVVVAGSKENRGEEPSRRYALMSARLTDTDGLVNLRARWSVSRGNCRHKSVRPARSRQTRQTQSGENSKTPAVSSSSSSLSLL